MHSVIPTARVDRSMAMGTSMGISMARLPSSDVLVVAARSQAQARSGPIRNRGRGQGPGVGRASEEQRRKQQLQKQGPNRNRNPSLTDRPVAAAGPGLLRLVIVGLDGAASSELLAPMLGDRTTLSKLWPCGILGHSCWVVMPSGQPQRRQIYPREGALQFQGTTRECQAQGAGVAWLAAPPAPAGEGADLLPINQKAKGRALASSLSTLLDSSVSLIRVRCSKPL